MSVVDLAKNVDHSGLDVVLMKITKQTHYGGLSECGGM